MNLMSTVHGINVNFKNVAIHSCQLNKHFAVLWLEHVWTSNPIMSAKFTTQTNLTSISSFLAIVGVPLFTQTL